VNNVFIIAEAGVNHNGDLDIAKKMVDAAKSFGADAVKFQAFNAEKIVSLTASKAGYQKKFTDKDESQLEMLKKLEIGFEEHVELMKHCEKKGIKFLSSPFDLESVEMLQKLEMDIYKIPSGEITNLPYLRKIGKLKKPVILSTGMATTEEIEEALGVLIKNGTSRNQITLLQCTTAYPAPIKDINLKFIPKLRDVFKVEVGFSDHTEGIEVALAAVALGATVIEKHFTLSRDMAGPDHKASLEPDEFERLVEGVRKIELALGVAEKKISVVENANKLAARKSIVAARNISKGDIFSDENITTKRPGDGLSPMLWDQIIGLTAQQGFIADEKIKLDNM
jgi:N,N'-diacetyllegionaminate synthase